MTASRGPLTHAGASAAFRAALCQLAESFYSSLGMHNTSAEYGRRRIEHEMERDRLHRESVAMLEETK